MTQLYSVMGVTFNNNKQQPSAQSDKQSQNQQNKKTTPNKPVAPAPADSTKNAQPPATKVDTTKVEQNTIPIKTKTPTQPIKLVEKKETTKKSRFSLSWSEIGKQAWKSTKKFVKGMFCDENGFSIARTATTVGIVAGLALAAPLAAACGASAAVVGGIALGTKIIGVALEAAFIYSGGKKTIEGTNEYLHAENREQAEAGMEKAMDGGVELASISVLGALFKTSGKLVKIFTKAKPTGSQPKPQENTAKLSNKNASANQTSLEPVQQAEPAPVVEPAQKPIQEPVVQSYATPAPKSANEAIVETKPQLVQEKTPSEPTLKPKVEETNAPEKSVEAQKASEARRAELERQIANAKTEPAEATAAKTEPAPAPKQSEANPQTTIQQNGIRCFTTSNGQNFSYEGINAEMFKITQISKDEATITLTDEIGLRQEMVGIVNSLTKQGIGIIEFFTTKPVASQLVATKPGRLKLIDGKWKLMESIQVTAE